MQYTERDKAYLQKLKAKGLDFDTSMDMLNKARQDAGIDNESSVGGQVDGVGRQKILNEQVVNKPEEVGALRSFAAGSATGLIETAGLIGSIPDIESNIKTAPLNFLYKFLPENIKEQVGQYLPESVTRDNPFEGSLKQLEASTSIMKEAQKGLGVNPERTATKVGTVLTPDVLVTLPKLGVNLVKAIPNMYRGTRTRLGDLGEDFIKFLGGIGSKDKDVSFLKENLEQGLKELNIEQADLPKILEDIKGRLPKTAQKELDLVDDILGKLKTKGQELTTMSREVSEKFIAKGEESLETISTLAKENIEQATTNTGLIGEGYSKFKGATSTIEGGSIGELYRKLITKSTKGSPSTIKRKAIDDAINEVELVADDAVSKNLDGTLKYEDLVNMRQNIDELINWGDAGSSKRNSALKEVRDVFDKQIISADFKASKEIDKAYSESVKFRDEIMETFGKEGIESPAFRKKIRNLHKSGNTIELRNYAKLLGKTPDEMTELSKKIDSQLKMTPVKTPVDVKKLGESQPTKKQLEIASNKLGANLSKKLNKLETAERQNEYLSSFNKAIKTDIDNAAELKTENMNERLVQSVFKALDSNTDEASGALTILEKEIGKDTLNKVKVAHIINKIKGSHSNSGFIAWMGTLGSFKFPIIGPALKSKFGTPEKALTYVLERASRLEKREKAIADNLLKNGKISESDLSKLINAAAGLSVTEEVIND